MRRRVFLRLLSGIPVVGAILCWGKSDRCVGDEDAIVSWPCPIPPPQLPIAGISVGTRLRDEFGREFMWVQYRGPAMVNVGDVVLADQVITRPTVA